MDDSQYLLIEAANARAIKETKWQLFAYGCLSSVIPGAGQYFRGLPKRGAIWFAIFLFVLIGVLIVQPWRTPDGRLPAYLVGGAILFAAGVDAAFGGTEEEFRPPVWGVLVFAAMAFITSWSVNPIAWRLTGYQIYWVSRDMEPTVHRFDKTVADQHAYRHASPHRGDVVVTNEYPLDLLHRSCSLKRVIAVPGDTIESKNGQIILNNVPIREAYIPGATSIDVSSSTDDNLKKRYTFGPVHLGPEELFVMGDDRGNAIDSRLRGPVKINSIRGKALYIADSSDESHDGKPLD